MFIDGGNLNEMSCHVLQFLQVFFEGQLSCLYNDSIEANPAACLPALNNQFQLQTHKHSIF